MNTRRAIQFIGPEMETLFEGIRDERHPVLSDFPEVVSIIEEVRQKGRKYLYKAPKQVRNSEGEEVRITRQDIFRRFVHNYESFQKKLRAIFPTIQSSFSESVRTAICNGFLPQMDDFVLERIAKFKYEVLPKDLIYETEAHVIHLQGAVAVSAEMLRDKQYAAATLYHEFCHIIAGVEAFIETAEDGEEKISITRVGFDIIDAEESSPGPEQEFDEAVADYLAMYLFKTKGRSPHNKKFLKDIDDPYYDEKQMVLKFINKMQLKYQLPEKKAWELIFAAYLENAERAKPQTFNGMNFPSAQSLMSYLKNS
jgi:hypothetical protein